MSLSADQREAAIKTVSRLWATGTRNAPITLEQTVDALAPLVDGWLGEARREGYEEGHVAGREGAHAIGFREGYKLAEQRAGEARRDERERAAEIVQGLLSDWEGVDGHDADAVCDVLNDLLNRVSQETGGDDG